MKTGYAITGLMVLIGAAFGLPALAESIFEPGIAKEDIRSGKEFQLPETQALQNDDFANPGFLSVDQGKDLFGTPQGKKQRACASCHGQNGEELSGVAARYPAIDDFSGKLFNLEQRINNCQKTHQQDEPSTYESEDLLALTAYVASLSRGVPFTVNISGPALPHFKAGQKYFYQRRGQLNLSCHHCHELNWGQMLRGDRLSQGHGTGYPAYRFDWQRVGSLHRRLRNCDIGVRAEPFGYGSPEYVDLELYLAWRASGLPVETPAVRR